jgi:hypothetical protein
VIAAPVAHPAVNKNPANNLAKLLPYKEGAKSFFALSFFVAVNN